MKLAYNEALIVFLTKTSYYDRSAPELGQSGQAIKKLSNTNMQKNKNYFSV